jgi:hypothetical protein
VCLIFQSSVGSVRNISTATLYPEWSDPNKKVPIFQYNFSLLNCTALRLKAIACTFLTYHKKLGSHIPKCCKVQFQRGIGDYNSQLPYEAKSLMLHQEQDDLQLEVLTYIY